MRHREQLAARQGPSEFRSRSQDPPDAGLTGAYVNTSVFHAYPFKRGHVTYPQRSIVQQQHHRARPQALVCSTANGVTCQNDPANSLCGIRIHLCRLNISCALDLLRGVLVDPPPLKTEGKELSERFQLLLCSGPGKLATRPVGVQSIQRDVNHLARTRAATVGLERPQDVLILSLRRKFQRKDVLLKCTDRFTDRLQSRAPRTFQFRDLAYRALPVAGLKRFSIPAAIEVTVAPDGTRTRRMSPAILPPGLAVRQMPAPKIQHFKKDPIVFSFLANRPPTRWRHQASAPPFDTLILLPSRIFG